MADQHANPYVEAALRHAWLLGWRAGYADRDLGACCEPFGARRVAWYEGHAAGVAHRQPAVGVDPATMGEEVIGV